MNTYGSNYENPIFTLLVVFSVMLLIFIIWGFFFSTIIPLIKDRRYIKMEIARSTNISEYRYWKKRLRRLYLSSIPIFGRFLR